MDESGGRDLQMRRSSNVFAPTAQDRNTHTTPGMNTATMKALTFGIEIETVGLGRLQLAEALRTALGGEVTAQGCDYALLDGKGRTWKVVPDGSLSGALNGEIVSPVLGYDDIGDLQEAVRAVRKAGGRADASAGIHVHIGANRFDAKSVTNLVKTVHKQERLIEHALGIRPERLARYCRPIEPQFLAQLEARRPKTLADVSAAWYGRANVRPTRYDSSRYHGLNLNSLFFRGTIEFRYFNGSLHAGEVKAYVQFVLALAAKGLTGRAASSKRRAFDPGTAKYDFRVFLLNLGLIGDEFKTARLHLTKHLAGSAAWKGERRDRRARPVAAPAAGEAESEGGRGGEREAA
jgi:Putative amidoligase enzyme